MVIECMLRGGDSIQLGDSNVSVNLKDICPGEEGMEAFKYNCHMVRSAIDNALPSMKEQKYVDFWQWAKNDFDTNGVSMPMVGKII